MRSVCVSEEWARKYQEICEQRDLPYKPWISRLAVYIAEGRDLVAGVQVYDTTGPWLFFEHLVTNQTASPRLRLRAVDLLIREGLAMCRLFGKLPQVTVQTRGIKSLLKKHGFLDPYAQMMTCPLSNLELHDYQSETYQEPFESPTQPALRRQNPKASGATYHRIEEDGPPLRPDVD